jgi:UDP-N-acetyl-D-glucosamine dehydrogenase
VHLLAGEKKEVLFAGVAVIGLGYVGLPLAVLAAKKGYRVLGIDKNREKVASLERGELYIAEVPGSELRNLTGGGLLRNVTEYTELPSYDVILVCVPTPLSDGGRPDYRHLQAAAKEIAARLRPGQLIIVESTVAPGTTASLFLPLLQERQMEAGYDFYLAYSPERIDPGNREYSLGNIPKLVAGTTPACRRLARFFYHSLGITTIPVRDMETAEMAKLLENTYRDVNIALVNEMAQVCRYNGLDIREVISAAATKPFGFQAFYPGTGVGGHCVPVDSIYYTTWARESGRPAVLAEKARAVNAAMPLHAANVISEALAEEGRQLAGSKILLLGVTYKKDINDTRESSALKLLELLQEKGAKVSFHDPLVQAVSLRSGTLRGVSLNNSILAGRDCVVIAVAHTAYDLSRIYTSSRLIVDLTNALAGFPTGKIRKL